MIRKKIFIAIDAILIILVLFLSVGYFEKAYNLAFDITYEQSVE